MSSPKVLSGESKAGRKQFRYYNATQGGESVTLEGVRLLLGGLFKVLIVLFQLLEPLPLFLKLWVRFAIGASHRIDELL